VARSESSRWLLCSVISKATEAIIATSKRVLMEGPVANKSFIAGRLLIQLKNSNYSDYADLM
jgi:hypothetical protein